MNFIVEHKVKGHYVIETIRGVEDLDTSMYQDILGIWITDSAEETDAMERELKELRNARSSQQT